MKKLNVVINNTFKNGEVLNRTQLKQVMGGGSLVEKPKECAILTVCAYHGSDGQWVSGHCGSSINGEQCRCIAQDGSSSVPFAGCLPN